MWEFPHPSAKRSHKQYFSEGVFFGIFSHKCRKAFSSISKCLIFCKPLEGVLKM